MGNGVGNRVSVEDRVEDREEGGYGSGEVFWK